MLQGVFNELLGRYTADKAFIDTSWVEIEHHYSEQGRRYHTLVHLEHLYKELLPYRDAVQDWDMVLFTLFYHDVIYIATQGDNEEQSALVAEERLSKLEISRQRIITCKSLIMATRTHQMSLGHDDNLFLDADLSIFGQPADVYNRYASEVREEYGYLPDMLYNPGRKNVLRHFLGLEQIFKTEEFRGKYEDAARENLQREIEMLDTNI